MGKKSLDKPERPRAKREDSKEIVEAILIAGRELALEGLDGFSFRALAKRAGVGEASVHRYFPSKGALFAEVFRRQHLELADQLRHELRSADSLATAVRRSVAFFIDPDVEQVRVRTVLNMQIPLAWTIDQLVEALEQTQAMMSESLRQWRPDLDDAEVKRRVFYALAYARGANLLRLQAASIAPPGDDILDEVSARLLEVLDAP